ncbi:MAG: glycosyltransferase family 2 protein [Chthoniobacterales bacterium]|nr:glycosyltransferase family 2 protein [Chthoniobacterales bacterium]
MNRCTYLLPIRRGAFTAPEAQEFASYFAMLRTADCEVVVVDGSPEEVFSQHSQTWRGVCRHESVDRRFGYMNDKVNGIHTGVEKSSREKIILADDDIRYTPADVERMCALLDEAEVVRPQNYLSPLPWWAAMEAARMLINRATLRIGDYPGTCAFRRSTMLRVGHYDGDVLFDNEEIIRHFAAAGASIQYAIDFFIHKRPPQHAKWKEQRPRQAYEDFGLRGKTALFASLPILMLLSALLAGFGGLLLCIVLIVLVACGVAVLGRGRGEAANFFPAWVPAYAPLWVFERSFSTYWALYWYFRHGGYPFGDKLLTKGIGRDWVSGGRVAAEAAAQRPEREDGRS